MTWMYNQVNCLPTNIESHIATCLPKGNLDQFSVPNIHCLNDKPIWNQVARTIERPAFSKTPPMGLIRKAFRQVRLQNCPTFVKHIIQETEAQILHSHFGQVGWANIDIARRTAAKHVITFYGQDVTWLPASNPIWLERYHQLFNQVSLVLCEGPFMAQSVIELGCPEEKVQVHHLGVRIDRIPFAPHPWQPDDPLRVLIAATFREKKGIPYALEALGKLQHKVPLEITIIGDASTEVRSQTEKKKILSIIDKHGLQSKIRMLGFQPHATLFEEAKRHHIFLSPSVTASDGDTEGGAPISIIEMAGLGLLIVSTTHCDIPEVIVHGRTGLLAAERDIDGLVDHLTWLIKNPDRWPVLAQAGRYHVETEYDAQIQGHRLADYYLSLITHA